MDGNRLKGARGLAVAALGIGVLVMPVRAETGSAEDSVPYTVPESPWPEQYGLHRAVVEVKAAGDAVKVRLPWRRRDEPAGKRLIVMDAHGRQVRNVFRVALNRWRADLVVGPVPAGGRWFVYYLPFPVKTSWGGYGHNYLPPEAAPDGAWVRKHRLAAGMDLDARKDIPAARLVAFQARTAFDSFWPMEVPMTDAQVQALLGKHAGPYLLFPEDRRHPIRMPEALPARWRKGPSDHFTGEALRNEYYAFQVGVFAARQELKAVTVTFSDLSSEDAVLPASRLTCFNTGGIDCYGRPFKKDLSVPKGKVQALWMGVDVPPDVRPGRYRGTVRIGAENAKPSAVTVALTVNNQVLDDRGDSDLWRHARLRWLNSTRGTGDSPIPPYTPLKRTGRAVTCLGRSVTVAPTGLPERIRSFGGEVLAGPMQLAVETAGARARLRQGPLRFVHESAGSVHWEARGRGDGLRLACRAAMEFDGHLLFRATLTAGADVRVKDVRLEIPFRVDAAEYMMGMGRGGGYVPQRHDWKWKGPQDSFWIGSADAGLHCELRGSTYHGPLLNRIRPPHPPAWHNGGRGGLRVRKTADRVTACVYSGERSLEAGQPAEFEFALLITPVKPLDTAAQFRNRYFHHVEPTEEHVKAGVRIINVHHGNELNPYINYPFVPEAGKRLKAFADKWHRRGLKVKIYYTLRELTNHIQEIWALRSLGTEVLAAGGGGGYPWLREHFRTNYWPRWYHHFPDGRVCAAVANSGESRWYNYYVESLARALNNLGVDGLYLDDVTYDRRILKRMRRVMAEVKPDCIIDLHSNTGFSIGPATQYAEFFPYVDKLWFGESFQYDRMSPDQWLVEVSGIPFGLMGDMLQGGGNRWLGMVYGMTARMPWTVAADPRPVWKVWDDFGIEKARMIGYWRKNCPVKADRGDVKVTAYVRKGRTLLAVGSWAKQKVGVRLTFDWRALGLDPARAFLHAPPVDGFQSEARWQPAEAIPVLPLKGWLIYVDQAPRRARARRKDGWRLAGQNWSGS